MVQNVKKLCPEPYIIWFSFMVYMCKKIIFLMFFLHFFQILFFRVNSAIKEQKMAQNDKKLFCCTPYPRKHTYDHDLWDSCVKWWHLQMLSFFKILVFQIVRGEGVGGMTKNSVSLTLYLRNHASYDCGFWSGPILHLYWVQLSHPIYCPKFFKQYFH